MRLFLPCTRATTKNSKKGIFLPESHNLTSEGILEILGMLHAAHPKCKLTNSLCQECIFIFLLCFQPLSLFLLPVALDHSESTVLKWILVQWSLYRNHSQPCNSHSAHKAVTLSPSMRLLSGSFTQIDNSLYTCSDKAEPSWYRGSLAIYFHEHWFLHFKAIFVSLSAPVFNYPAGIFPFHKQNTKHSATEMHQNYCPEKHVWCLSSCVSQWKFTDLSTALMHRSIWVGPTKDRWPSCSNQMPSAFTVNAVISAATPAHQSWHLVNEFMTITPWCFYKLCWTDFSPFRNWKMGNSCLIHLGEVTQQH